MFVALDLPEAARGELAAWREALVGGRADLRPVRPEALHVTLVFLGWQDERAAGAIAAAAFESVTVAAPLLRCGEVRGLPPRSPRLFALDLTDEEGRASLVQAEVSRALERWYKPEKRPFWPHITLARVKSAPARSARHATALPASPSAPQAAFRAGTLTLYRSTLRPQGALYEPLARSELR